jgi:hypothetical protein
MRLTDSVVGVESIGVEGWASWSRAGAVPAGVRGVRHGGAKAVSDRLTVRERVRLK